MFKGGIPLIQCVQASTGQIVEASQEVAIDLHLISMWLMVVSVPANIRVGLRASEWVLLGDSRGKPLHLRMVDLNYQHRKQNTTLPDRKSVV